MNEYNNPNFENTPSQPEEQTVTQPAQPQWQSYTYVPTPETNPQPAKKEKKRRPGLRLALVALCCSLVGSALGAGGVLLAQHLTDRNSPSGGTNTSVIQQGNRENTVIDIVEVETGKLMTPAEVYAANAGSTVGITTSITTNFWGYTSTSAASGSGFIISDDGYILTNFHVIEDSDSITVALFDGSEHDAALIGYDESNDIAVLKIEAEGLSPVILGDSDNLNVGDTVVAIGNPLGELTFSLTQGVVSAKDREVTFSGNVTMNLMQTDCAINSGNSGGALFNLYGEVIGVTNAKYSGNSGSGASIDNIGFAIPINSVRSIVESIMEKGYIAKPYIGIGVIDVAKEYQMYGLPAGAAVQSVTDNGPADKAGLKTGDIITAAGEKEITCSDDLIRVVSGVEPGDELVLTVYRKGQTVTVTVTVEEQIQSAAGNSQQSGTSRPSGSR